MSRPLVLITPHMESENAELSDPAVSLSNRYSEAIMVAGGLPLILPSCTNPVLIRESVARADGILLSGGEDVAPELYGQQFPPAIRERIVPAIGGRDLGELMLIEEIFRQRKALLAICRGQQILNVALGGDLIGDIPLQVPEALDHSRQNEAFEPVHDLQIEPDSVLARVTGCTSLGANSTHHQAVSRVAPPLRISGRSPDGIIEALELAATHSAALPFLLSVQFHPERLFDRHPAHARVFEAFISACRPGATARSQEKHSFLKETAVREAV